MTTRKLTGTQHGALLRKWFSRPAERLYRLRPRPKCGRQRMYVCQDARLRCKECALDEPTTDEDLAAVFGSVSQLVSRFDSDRRR
jgi:hypothetical protein